MTLRTIAALILFILLSLLHAETSDAVNLSVGNASGAENESVRIPILVDNPVGISGAAFTITYGRDNLNLTHIESTFFDTFANQWAALSPPPDPYPDESVNVGGTNYSQPLLTRPAEESDGGGTLLAAARCKAEANPSNKILFILSFTLKSEAPLGGYPVTVAASTINQINAGYAPQGEAVPILVGSDPSKNISDPDAYPVIPVDSITPGTVIFTERDADRDGMDDTWERQIVDASADDDIRSVSDVLPDEDYDGDRLSNLKEFERGTDPTDPESPLARPMPWIPVLLLE